jgi:triosephosphate isomerase (TIM)
MTKPRGVLIAGNWKMNLGLKATGEFFQKLRPSQHSGEFKTGTLKACVFPPTTSLLTALSCARTAPFAVSVGAQNVHWEKSGAFTGEVSGPMLSELGISWTLVGHSERRQYFGETDETARKRSESLLAQGFQVILCIGETRSEREQMRTHEVLKRQIDGAIAQASSAFLDGRLIIAYEPVWAIGTGLTATPAQAEEAHQFIRKHLWDRFGMEASGRTPILYGGSVNTENADTLLVCPNIDGALVGGASLKPDAFLALVEAGGRALFH